MFSRVFVCIVGLLLLPVTYVFAVDIPEPEVQFLHRSTAAIPGETSQAGLFVTLAQGWHVYWKSPGGIGLPTKVAVTLPAGVTAGEVLWPMPVQFEQPGEMIGYGYKGEFAFLLPLTFSKSLQSGSTVSIGAKIDWLYCSKDVCVPGEIERTLTVPVQRDAIGQYSKRFGKAEKNLPFVADSLPAGGSVQNPSAIRTLPGVIKPAVKWWEEVSNMSAFINPPPGVAADAGQLNLSEGAGSVVISLSRDGSDSPASGTGEVLFVAATRRGARRRVGVSIPFSVQLR